MRSLFWACEIVTLEEFSKQTSVGGMPVFFYHVRPNKYLHLTTYLQNLKNFCPKVAGGLCPQQLWALVIFDANFSFLIIHLWCCMGNWNKFKAENSPLPLPLMLMHLIIRQKGGLGFLGFSEGPIAFFLESCSVSFLSHELVLMD